eukprot:tig00020564_g11409.t1
MAPLLPFGPQCWVPTSDATDAREEQHVTIPVFPVWRQQCALDDHMKGALLRQQFADFSTEALFEAGFASFAHTVSQTIHAAGGAAAAGAAEAADAAALLSTPEARCPLEGSSDHVVLWCSPQDAGFARAVVLGLADRGIPCWADCQSVGDGALRDRLQLAEVAGRPVRPVLLSPAKAPGLPPGSADAAPFAFLTEGNVAFFSNLDALLASVPFRSRQRGPLQPQAQGPHLASTSPSAEAGGAGPGPGPGPGSGAPGQAPAAAPAHAPGSEIETLLADRRRELDEL